MCEETREDPISQEDNASMIAFYGCSEAAFDALHDRWWARLFGYFRREGVSAEDAEDLALLTLVKLYATKERQSFNLTRPLSPFLFTVARNELRNWHRERGRRVTEVPFTEASAVTIDMEDVDSPLSAAVADCIRMLPPLEQRYVVHCAKHGLGDMSHGEIAAALGKWPAQVTQISQAARSSLERCLRAKGYS